jgi:hypothetical protein
VASAGFDREDALPGTSVFAVLRFEGDDDSRGEVRVAPAEGYDGFDVELTGVEPGMLE